MSALALVGLSHHVAPVELRERVTLDLDHAATLARSLGDAVCLSTCNRTEVYLAGADERQAVAALEELAGESLDGVVYRLHEDAAALHLFRVAAGLDSLVPGEGEILGQVRSAYEAVEPGPLLDRVFRQALHAGRKVRAQTAIGQSPASVSAAAAALAEQVFGSLEGRSILLLGAGKVSDQAARNLRSRGAEITLVANRKTERERIHEELSAVDVVIASTSAPGLVLEAATVSQALRSRRGRRLLLVDLAVPRDLDPAIGESPASVSSAAAALAAQVFGKLTGRRVLLVGAGRIGELAASNLASRGAEIAYVANRTPETAAELAHRFGGRALALEEIAAALVDVDVVVSSTSASGLVLEAATVSQALRSRRGRRLLLVDLAVPRDLDPAIGELDGCYLYDIDDLEQIVVETLSLRRREAERAETIVAAEAERFHEWHASLDVVPAIASLRARAEEIREAELQKAESLLGRLDESQRRAVEAVTAQIVNKLLHLPTVRMKQAAAAADGVLYAETVRHLFGLGEDER
jgi:glutamyl-tRNA reductase